MDSRVPSSSVNSAFIHMTCPTSISLTFNPYDHHEVEFGNECLVVAKTMYNIMFEIPDDIHSKTSLL